MGLKRGADAQPALGATRSIGPDYRALTSNVKGGNRLVLHARIAETSDIDSVRAFAINGERSDGEYKRS